MSLTSELKKIDSPVRAFLDGLSAPLASTYGNTKTANLAVQKLGFAELIDLDPLVPLASGVNAPQSGTAFDIRTRIAIDRFDLESSASALGLDAIIAQVGLIQNGEHRARVMMDLYDAARSLLLAAQTEEDLDLASLLLTPSEQFLRAGPLVFGGALGAALDAAEDGQSFIESVRPESLTDIRGLRIANGEQIMAWREDIAAGEPFEGNPTFVGSFLVGGADGDWVAGDTLVDCKVYAKLTVPKLRDFLRQLLGYVMLDLDDALKIRSVGVWLPRQVTMPIWSLESLLGGDPEVLLPTLREAFVKATHRNQAAVHVPVSEQRKLQLVADNRFSPRAMLWSLAHSDDRDLRMRVARNPATPADVLWTLSEDRYATVREGVAANSSTPQDVIHRLASDKSIAVRRAAAGNSGSMLAVDKALPAPAASAVPASTELVATPLHANVPMAGHHVEIRQDRNPQEIDFELLWRILAAMSANGSIDITLPKASQAFAWATGRQPVLPESLRRGVPISVLEFMCAPERPSSMRRMAAAYLPVKDPVIRARLLADSDVEIRWAALRRSMSCVDEQMGEFLAVLAGSREARIEFSTAGVPCHDLRRRPSEYDEEVLVAIAAHPALPQGLLHTLTEQPFPRVLLSLAGNPTLNDEGFNLLVERMLLVTSTESRRLFAESTFCPESVLEKFAANQSAEIRIAVAENPSAPDAALARLARDNSTEVRIAVAQNCFASEGILESLGQDQELAVRIAVLRNRSSSTALVTGVAEELLRTLSNVPLFDVLYELRWRDDIPLPDELVGQALDRLLKSRSRPPEFRSFVARHNRTSETTLARLAKSVDEDLRLDVAGNPRTPQDTLNMLLCDESLAVRVRAARAVEANAEPDDSSEEPAAELEIASSPTPAITVADLHEMVASKRADIRKQAAYNSAATPDMLTFLAGDRRSVIVRRIVAANPGTPPSTLRELTSENDAQINQSIAFNSGTPIDVLIDLAGQSIDLALLVAFNPDAPDEILGALAEDDDPLVRFVAQEFSAVRQSLRLDGHVNRSQELDE